ncbi:MAG: trimeric intracellular cation channel family protein [Longimicrobiales bacterium]
MTLLRVLDLLGVAVFAASGTLAAGRKRLDLLGALVVAAVTAIGGGTLRDVLLGQGHVFWIDDPVYLWVIVIASAVTMVYGRLRKPPNNALAIADALGLGLFAIGGVQVAQAAGHGGIVAVILGTMTGAAGGVIRDVLTNDVPMILRKGELYATAAIAGTTLYLVLQAAGFGSLGAGVIGAAAIVSLRIAAITWGLHLPTFAIRE